MPSPSHPSLPSAAPEHHEARIVVIDDEPLNTDALTQFLRAAGYAQVQGLDGAAASVQRLRAELPDLVLLELAPAQADALDLLQRLQADHLLRHVPVIVLTAHDDLANRLRALALGAADFLHKPVDAGEFTLRLRNTLAAKAYRDQVAHTDPLTGLPNRSALQWRLDWAMRHAQRHGTAGAVLQLGFDRFEQINDALGPAVADELLHAVSQRLVAELRDSDVVARGDAALSTHTTALLSRGSGDEFSVLLPVIERVEDAAAVAARLIERLAAPFRVGGHELFVACRVGMAVFPGDEAQTHTHTNTHTHADTDGVLQQAGVAMRHSRHAGPAGGGYQFYRDDLNALSLRRLTMARELHHALERGELVLHYQPQVEARSGRVCGAEALVRWLHPQRGLLGPAEFIPVAEEAGLIARLGCWVLHEALQQLAAWRADGLLLPQMAVNVSSMQLQHPRLRDEVAAALGQAGLAGSDLCLELTESAMIDGGPQVTTTLEAIKRLGVGLSLDDFGTGYSSLTHLRRFPIDEIKIDRSFVGDCSSAGGNAAITAAIIAMARRLCLRVVAEGVEEPQQLAFIVEHEADVAQGYLFSRPLAAREFGLYLKKAAGPQLVRVA
jgi:diguanylate cyclase